MEITTELFLPNPIVKLQITDLVNSDKSKYNLLKSYFFKLYFKKAHKAQTSG